jgi:undecaprenyl diphosphate synthase
MVPRHIGFIMDGNGRWAVAHNLARAQGYAEGLKALVRVAARCRERGVEAISVYAFSTENFARPAQEINAVASVVERFNRTYDGGYKVTYMGDADAFGDAFAESVDAIERLTETNSGFTLNIAFNYGGRADILRAAETAYDHGEFTEDTFEKRLSSSHLPPLDMIVRTGGEKRLSNFMLYEAAYAELVFLDKYWPDMTAKDIDDALEEFDARQRKFGA